jgi:hypothetical protein
MQVCRWPGFNNRLEDPVPIKLRLPIILPNCAKVLSFCSSWSGRNRLGLEGVVENPAQLNFSGGVQVKDARAYQMLIIWTGRHEAEFKAR